MANRTYNIDKTIEEMDFYDLREGMLDLLSVIDAIEDGTPLDDVDFSLENLERLSTAISGLTVAAAKDGKGSHPTLDWVQRCKK